MKKKGLIITIVVILLVLIGGRAAFGSKGNKEKEVNLFKVQKGELNSYLSTSGTVKSKNVKDYYGSGLKVDKVNVKVGDTIKKGAVLVTYDTSDLKLQVKQAEIQHSNAVLQKQDTVNQNKNLEDKKADLDKKIKELEASPNPQDQLQIPTLKQQRDAIQSVSSEKLKQLDNSVALAKASLDAVQNKYNAVKDGIIADFDGVITTLNAVSGGMSNPSAAVATLQDLNSLKLIIALNKFDTEKVKVEQSAQVKNNNKSYNGKVAFISPSASKQGNLSMAAAGGSTEGNLSAEIDILDSTPDLKVDFEADVDILVGNVTDALKIPIEALVSEKDGRNFVFVIENGLAKKKEVTVGLQSATEVQIVEGLAENEAIILNTTDLKDGDKVIEKLKEE